MRVLVLLLALAACGGAREPQSEEAIANQAESLERAANATVDQQIAEIEAASIADRQTDANVTVNLTE